MLRCIFKNGINHFINISAFFTTIILFGARITLKLTRIISFTQW